MNCVDMMFVCTIIGGVASLLVIVEFVAKCIIALFYVFDYFVACVWL